MSEPLTARMRSVGSIPESTASATLGPMPLTAMRRWNRVELERGDEPEELQRILAHMRVHAQGDASAWLADGIERRQRDLDVVADPAHVDDQPLHVFFEKRARQMSDHGA